MSQRRQANGQYDFTPGAGKSSIPTAADRSPAAGPAAGTPGPADRAYADTFAVFDATAGQGDAADVSAVETRIAAVLSVLDSADQAVVQARLLAPDSQPVETLDVVGARLNLTREQVRQTESRAASAFRAAHVDLAAYRERTTS